MSDNKREIEAKGATVDEAVAAGAAQLGVPQSEVIVEVIDEGSRGLLGLGARDAVVRVTTMIPAKPAKTPKPQPEKAPKPKPETAEPAPKPAQQEPVAKQPPAPPEKPAPAAKETAVAPTTDDAEPLADELAEDGETAVAIVTEMMDKLGVDVDVSRKLSDPDEMSGKRMTVVEITGDDLGVLIGPGGDTLDAIQYLTRLMVGHKLHRRAEFMVDVQGYRDRREQALTRLAERMAQKALKRNRSVSLEPMSPYERRIIHMALRDHDKVRTNSVGEGKRRRVRVIPK